MTESTFEQSIIEKLRSLPSAKQQEVLNFVESLGRKDRVSIPRRSLKDLWADLEVNISEEDISDLRRELWSNFPRDDI